MKNKVIITDIAGVSTLVLAGLSDLGFIDLSSGFTSGLYAFAAGVFFTKIIYEVGNE